MHSPEMSSAGAGRSSPGRQAHSPRRSSAAGRGGAEPPTASAALPDDDGDSALPPATDDAHAAVFERYRALLFHIAYRMLGTVSDAEDVLQEAWIRWQRGGTEPVQRPKGYLSQMVTRLAIDRLREVQRARATYIGPWLPEPLLTVPDAAPGVGEVNARAESLRLGFLLLLEQLGPIERAVFVLREGFDYDYAEIAALVGKRESNCRQILARARKRLRTQEHAAPATPASDAEAARNQVANAFIMAIAGRDLAAIERMLTPDAVFRSDGGGVVSAARNPIVGSNRVARFLVGVQRKYTHHQLRIRRVAVNGEPGLALYIGPAPYNIMAFDIIAGRVRAIRAVMNPNKLVHLYDAI